MSSSYDYLYVSGSVAKDKSYMKRFKRIFESTKL